jgi:hypothetical protein
MDISPYRIKDDEFWARPTRGSDRLASELVGVFSGPLVDAPRRIPIDKRTTFPMGLYQMGSMRELSTVPFEKYGMIVAVDVTNNRLYVASGRSFNPDSDPIESPPAEPSTHAEGSTCATSSLELRNVMKLPWQPARYLVTAIIRDQVSNRSAVELCQSASCHLDPETRKQQATELAKSNPGAVDPPPGGPLPNYQKNADSPAIPDQPGIVLSAPRTVDVRREEPWLVQGTFRLTPIPQEMVKPGWTDAHYPGPPGNERPTAVMTIYLLVTGADTGRSNFFPLRVPSWSPPGGAATGHFAVDLRKFRGMPTTQQTYFIYAFSGMSMTGPVPAAVGSAH